MVTNHRIDLESGWYLTGRSNGYEEKYFKTIGQIWALYRQGINWSALDAGIPWMLDNSAFNQRFEIIEWKTKLKKLAKYSRQCISIVIPDYVGDALKTIKMFHKYKKYAKGYPIAFVSQDGISQLAELIPWDEFDCLFVGGSDEHKLGREGGWIINQAKHRGKWIHIGRVNSPSRIDKFWRADSWDGSNIVFTGDWDKFHRAVIQVRNKKKQKGLFDDLHIDVPWCYRSGQPSSG